MNWDTSNFVRNAVAARRTLRILHQDALVGRLVADGNIYGRVPREEVDGLQAHHHLLDRHDGPLLDAGVVRRAKRVPEHNILVADALAPTRDERVEPVHAARRLHRVHARRVQLLVVVPRDPDGVGAELGPRRVQRPRVREDHLRVVRHQLVSHRAVGDGVDRVLVDDLEHPGLGDVRVQPGLFLDDGLARHVADAGGVDLVGVVERHGVGLLDQERVLLPVDRRIDAQAEEVLVVRREHPGGDDGAVGDRASNVDGVRAEDARGAHLVRDLGGLVEVKGEDVLIVVDGDDGLEDQNPGPSDDGIVGAEVGVLPEDTIVLLMAAHGVGQLERVAGKGVVPCVEILDGTKTVASQLQIVGIHAGAVVSQIKRGLAWIWCPTVAVRNKHFRERQPVEQFSTVIGDVVDGQSFALLGVGILCQQGIHSSACFSMATHIVEAHSHSPLLPVDQIPLDLERRTFWLNDLVRLGGGSPIGLKLWMVLAGVVNLAAIKLIGLAGTTLDHSISFSQRKGKDLLNDVVAAHLSTDVQRIGKVVGILVRRQTHVYVALRRRQSIIHACSDLSIAL